MIKNYQYLYFKKIFIFLACALVDHHNVIVTFIVIDIVLRLNLKISDIIS